MNDEDRRTEQLRTSSIIDDTMVELIGIVLMKITFYFLSCIWSEDNYEQMAIFEGLFAVTFLVLMVIRLFVITIRLRRYGVGGDEDDDEDEVQPRVHIRLHEE